ncbi:hypothetical protein [Pararhizobium qamdonense]|uniref:hypothetical protein n=1 Tax=Pararhizobium qamdonense TaxID=3031126 RepID=UPI0023E0D1D0|nr:hypothetical protein [Pararhizobium qamdonense]
MHPVNLPVFDGQYAARDSDCVEALDGKVQQLFEEAFRAGWAREETAAALFEIAERHAKIVSSQNEA